MTILDVFDRPATVRVRGLTIRVPQLTLRDLADLQAWVRDQSWDPFDVPDVDCPLLFWALVIEEAEGWPPQAGSELATLATPSDEYAAEFAWVAFGRHNGLSREDAAAVAGAARADVVPWQAIQSAAYAVPPGDVASGVLNLIDGAVPEPAGTPIDWRAAIASLVLDHGRAFAEVESWTIGQFRLIRSCSRDDKGRLRVEVPGVGPRPRPGEAQKDADARRRAILEEATAVLEALYTAQGAGPISPSPGP